MAGRRRRLRSRRSNAKGKVDGAHSRGKRMRRDPLGGNFVYREKKASGARIAAGLGKKKPGLGRASITYSDHRLAR